MKLLYSSLIEAFLFVLLIILFVAPIIVAQTVTYHPIQSGQAVLGAQVVVTRY